MTKCLCVYTSEIEPYLVGPLQRKRNIPIQTVFRCHTVYVKGQKQENVKLLLTKEADRSISRSCHHTENHLRQLNFKKQGLYWTTSCTDEILMKDGRNIWNLTQATLKFISTHAYNSVFSTVV